MPWWWWVIDVLALVVVLTLVVLVALAVRRRYLTRHGGTFDLSINRRSTVGSSGWTLGVAVYGADTLNWYRTFSVRLRPSYRFVRGEVHVEGRRRPVGAEAHAVHAGHVIVTTTSATDVRQMAMGPDALTGLLAWLESSPPGRSVNTVV
ncbi:DUF2550 domain-containing protein [Aeromicrobium sp. CF4.19]|uniref:DUF2550 domain-containing protein n=1 Tax=Aeromicrobium sp. CF4.19 TaxID=3373082 RepID=UPI003EE5F748